MKISGKKVNFLGDSITAGVHVEDPKDFFVNVLKAEYGLAEARNYGISGTRLAKQMGYSKYGPSFSERFGEMDDDADIVVVFGGTNDYGHGDAPVGTPSDRTMDTFYGACHYLYKGLIEKYPDSLIIVITPLHREGDFLPKQENKLPLKAYVDIIREVAEYYSLPILDLFATGKIQPNIPIIKEKYCPDGLHPSKEGHRLIAERINGFIEQF